MRARPARGPAAESDRDTHETRHARPRGDLARAALRVMQKRFIAATQHALSGASRQSLEPPV